MPRGRTGPRQANDRAAADLFSDAPCDLLFFERDARAAGFGHIAGLDEAGRGPLAGPVVAAAVAFPEGLLIPGVTDSKKLSPAERLRLYEEILRQAQGYGIGIVDERTIDDVNIYQASILAMERAVANMEPRPDFLLIDALCLPRTPIRQHAIIKGDCRCHSIAAASILAKVTRDRIMVELHEKFPQYLFHKHKGYGTREHLSLIRRFGPCEAHRRSFSPVAELLHEAQ